MTTTPPSLGVGLRIDPATTPDLDIYRASGGGQAIAAARRMGPDEVIGELRRAGLRGRGGAGFPTAVKWRTVRDGPDGTRHVVCNAAEGEPSCFKDRWLLRHAPHLVVEGAVVAAHAVGATQAHIAMADTSTTEQERVEIAAEEMASAGWLGDVEVVVTAGPDAYLLGEETALLEAIEGRPPMPRVLPPYQVGLFAGRGRPNPTLVNNAETLAHVPGIVRFGAQLFRMRGTTDSPGTMLFTVSGDVQRETVSELDLGTPLRVLVEEAAGGARPGHAVRAVVPGASGGILPADRLDTRLDFDAMRAAGSSLGAGGFLVVDDATCIVRVVAGLAQFLADESCGQCPACPTGTDDVAARLAGIEEGRGCPEDLERIEAKCRSMTGGARCGLPAGGQALVASLLEHFRDDLMAHVDGECPWPGVSPLPLFTDWVGGRFTRRDQALVRLPATSETAGVAP